MKKKDILYQINELKKNNNITKRPVADELEKILYDIFPILDYGFIRVVDYMGNDNSIVQSARVSYGKGTKHKNKDKALINYLMEHRHTTPFEMCEIKFHIKLPIFVARQWIRHRMSSYNEYSARYSILEDEFYIPKANDLSIQSSLNHQARENDYQIDKERQKEIIEILKSDSKRCYNNYLSMINRDKKGDVIKEENESLARELARINLTLNCYTQWYWKIDLHNLLHFLSLRADSHAQYEIRIYAEEILKIIKKWVPITFDSFVKFRMNSHNLSQEEIKIMKEMILNKNITAQTLKISDRKFNKIYNIINS